ncbi:spore protease YyaC [Priestia endophytica]|uniref:spore protease YyaC n=1 Tax=Priestia endophytica TaxID=135735 RepID=UPI00227F7301|nr:spore protease YyaC [Priestia endophytica]MCY8230941.1 spore protease YyaC [Priestia endophytica]
MNSAEQSFIKLTSDLAHIMQSKEYEHRDIIFLCIGSDRSIGDSLGPLVGTMLKEKKVPFEVYGTLETPVHAFNLEDTLKKITKRFKKSLIISIDASLGDEDHVGSAFLKKGPVVPGKALKKLLPKTGDFHITGVVNYVDPLPSTQFLNDTRLYIVRNLALAISEAVYQASLENVQHL